MSEQHQCQHPRKQLSQGVNHLTKNDDMRFPEPISDDDVTIHTFINLCLFILLHLQTGFHLLSIV